jgi:hypothetical protein
MVQENNVTYQSYGTQAPSDGLTPIVYRPSHIFSLVRPTLLYFWWHVVPHLMWHPACLHKAAPAKAGLCFSRCLFEFIPMKIGAGMMTIRKGFMTRYTGKYLKDLTSSFP